MAIVMANLFFFVITSVERVVIANGVWRSVGNEIASVISLHRGRQNTFTTKLARKRQEPHVRTAITFPSKTSFSKNKSHLKLSSKSVGQGRGGLEGTVRPSQLRAGSPPKKRIQKKISLRGRQNPHE